MSETPKLGLSKPESGETGWTGSINGNLDTLDDSIVVKSGWTPPGGDVANGQSRQGGIDGLIGGVKR